MKKLDEIKMVLFDIDNTLVYGKRATKFYSQYGRTLEKTLAKELKILEKESRVIADAFRSRFDGRGERSFEALELGIDIWYDAIMTISPEKYLEKMQKTPRILSSLKRKYIIGAITDGPINQAYKILSVSNIDTSLFDFIIGWKKGKQMPKGGRSEIFEEVCKKQNIDPKNAVMVGDSLNTDILPAIRAGMHAVHITQRKTKEKIEYRVIKNIEELSKVLN